MHTKIQKEKLTYKLIRSCEIIYTYNMIRIIM